VSSECKSSDTNGNGTKGSEDAAGSWRHILCSHDTDIGRLNLGLLDNGTFSICSVHTLLVDFSASLQSIRYLNLVGRQSFGAATPDFAGIAEFSFVNQKIVENWSVCILPFLSDFRRSINFATGADSHAGCCLPFHFFSRECAVFPSSSIVTEFRICEIPIFDSRVYRLVVHPDSNFVCSYITVPRSGGLAHPHCQAKRSIVLHELVPLEAPTSRNF